MYSRFPPTWQEALRDRLSGPSANAYDEFVELYSTNHAAVGRSLYRAGTIGMYRHVCLTLWLPQAAVLLQQASNAVASGWITAEFEKSLHADLLEKGLLDTKAALDAKLAAAPPPQQPQPAKTSPMARRWQSSDIVSRMRPSSVVTPRVRVHVGRRCFGK